jgi:hypothetical protein
VDIVATAIIVLWSIQAIGTVIYLFQFARLLNRLKASHVGVWESLGSLSLLVHNTPSNNWLVLRWLWTKGYSELNDPAIERRAGVVRASLVALIANFILLVLLFFSSFALYSPLTN